MIVTRFAPSPTGYLHIGSLRTVLYNYLYAKQKNGKFMLRVEDTDRTRLVEGSIENLINVLEKVGLSPDEGPNKIGDKGPYYQSERLDIYKKYIDQLIKNDKAYYCFCSSERLTMMRKEQEELKLAPKYDGTCRFLTQDEIKEKLDLGMPYTVRLKVPKNEKIIFNDLIKGKIEVNSNDIDDQVLLKSDGFPTYHMASIVDDHLMEVTHVIRGDEWTPSTPKHILLYQAMGWTPPVFSHIPLLLGTDKKKLSKRQGDVAVEDYLAKGYMVEPLLNYISLLGWNPKTCDEIFSIDELISKFDLDNVHKSGAVFDVEKLDWFSAKYMVSYDIEKLYKYLEEYLKTYDKDFYENIFSKADREYNKKILKELQTRIKKLSDFKELTTFFYSDAKINTELLINAKMKIPDMETVQLGLVVALNILKSKNNDFNSIQEMKEVFIEKIKESGMKNGQVLWPVRVVLSGETFSPGGLEMIYILGNEKSIERIEKVLEFIT